jgi:16S rRNA (guanine966-N2)-methyltransferase
VRVIAGEARGRRLQAPEGLDTRPTADRVREATFNALGSLDAIDGATVLDLFAGSGAMGIEALSRGASHATFVDHESRAIHAIETNLAATGLADRATVVRARVERFLAEAALDARRWGVCLIDPPYVFDDWPALLATVPADLVVVESDRSVETSEAWRAIRERRYGATLVAILRPHPPTAAQIGLAHPE